MHNLNIAICLKLIFIVSLVSIISAFFIEYILGYQPCNLCLIERLPYGFAMFLIMINFIINRYRKFFILLLILVFVFSLLISVYHFGIEVGFFEESGICGLKGATEIISKEELLEQLSKKTVSCKDVTFRIFGFSLTTINIILILFINILLIIIFLNYEKLKN